MVFQRLKQMSFIAVGGVKKQFIFQYNLICQHSRPNYQLGNERGTSVRVLRLHNTIFTSGKLLKHFEWFFFRWENKRLQFAAGQPIKGEIILIVQFLFLDDLLHKEF